MVNKERILQSYKNSTKLDKQQRQSAFTDKQLLGEIPSDIKYSDEAYYDYIGKEFASLPSPEVANSYLVNVYNKLGRIDFKRISGERNSLFNRGLQPLIPAGDTLELMYTNLQETTEYDRDEFVPTSTKGGELVYSQRIRLSTLEKGKNNPDKRKVNVVVPTLEIMQALQPAISNGLTNGWPTIFDEQMERSWELFKFERFRNLVARAGGKPNKDEWMNPETTFTPNTASFVEVDTAITDIDSFQQFLLQLYGVSATLEGEYSDKYNPAGIKQITRLNQQGLFLDSAYEPYWRGTNAILFNSVSINVKQIYNSVDFFKFLPSVVEPKAKKVIAVLYADYPFLHAPFTNGILRLVHMWPNAQSSIYDHFWLASGNDLSKNIIVFYEKQTEE